MPTGVSLFVWLVVSRFVSGLSQICLLGVNETVSGMTAMLGYARVSTTG